MQRAVCVAFAKGCPRSKLDAARLIDYFKVNAWEITSDFRRAALILVSTCGATCEAENSSLALLNLVHRKRAKSSKLCVFGCLPGINRQRLIESFDLIPLTRNELNRLDGIIEARVRFEDVPTPNDLSDYVAYSADCFTAFDRIAAEISGSESLTQLAFNSICKARSLGLSGVLKTAAPRLSGARRKRYPAAVDNQKIFNIRVATGCTESCSYCAIRFATGFVKSVPMDVILSSLDAGLSKGYRLFRLIGEDVGAYGVDIGTNIVELLQEILGRDADFRLMVGDFSPKWLVRYFPDFLKVVRGHSPKFAYLLLPIQSGSERILKWMGRDYQAKDVLECLLQLKAACPDLTLYTHVLVGFPGEEAADFRETLKFLKTARFNKVTVYKYSDRPGTPASQLPNRVSDREISRRMLKASKF